jgi:hypothetical protein
MGNFFLALALASLPATSQACSLPIDFADYYKNDLTLEVLRDYRVSGTVDNVQNLTITNLDVLPYNTFKGKIACFDSVRMSGTVSMKLTRKVSHNLEKKLELDRALGEGQLSETEYEARVNELETCSVRAEVNSVKAPKKAGEMAYRYDSKIGLEISCD